MSLKSLLNQRLNKKNQDGGTKFKIAQPSLVSWRDAIYFGNPVHSKLAFSHG